MLSPTDQSTLLSIDADLCEAVAVFVAIRFVERVRLHQPALDGRCQWVASLGPEPAEVWAAYLLAHRVVPQQLLQDGGAPLHALLQEATSTAGPMGVTIPLATCLTYAWMAQVVFGAPGDDGEAWCCYTVPNVMRFVNCAKPGLMPALALGHRSCVAALYLEDPKLVRVSLKAGRFGCDTPLHFVVARGHMECAELLMELSPACVSRRDSNGRTVLHHAVRANVPPLLRRLLALGVQQSVAARFGVLPIHYACRSGHFECLQCLVSDSTACVNTPARGGDTPVHEAARGGHFACLQLLVNASADVHHVNQKGETALFCAVDAHSVDCVDCLLSVGARCDVIAASGESPLHNAARWGNEGVVETLYRRGVPIDAQTTYGYTALHYAAQSGHAPCVKLLLTLGADPLLASPPERDSGKSTLHMAAQGGSELCVQYLLDAGVPVNIMDNSRCTPLHDAARNGHASCVGLLIQRGADVRHRNGWYGTALHAAVENCREACVKLLVEAGASTTVRDNQGKLPMHYAEGRETLLTLLKTSIQPP